MHPLLPPQNAAESGIRPSWWKEFLQKIRMAIAKIPGFKNVRMSDNEIEILLARSARAMRRRAEAQTDMGMRFAMDAENGK